MHKTLTQLADEALADDKRATKGPWQHRTGQRYMSWVITDPGGREIALLIDVHDDDDPSFIAAARSREPLLAQGVIELSKEVERVTAALDAALTRPIGSDGHRALVDVMQARYGREAHQWKANHDQRKSERDKAHADNERFRAVLQTGLTFRASLGVDPGIVSAQLRAHLDAIGDMGASASESASTSQAAAPAAEKTGIP